MTSDTVVAEEPKIKEITDEEAASDTSEPIAIDEDVDTPEAGADAVNQDRKLSRHEAKARKAIAKLGLKPVPGITRVAIKRPKGILFVINQPQVFKFANSDTHIVFGEARIEDMSSRAQANAAEQFKPPTAQEETKEDEVPELEEADEGEVDETGLESKDIELVMKNAGVSRSKAVTALRNNNNDIVNAIMELSM